jgi:diguanylate cyclase (GGDEF)-like protein
MKISELKQILDFQARLAEKSAASTDLRQLIDSIIVEAITFIEASSASIMVYDPEEFCLKLHASSRHPRLKKTGTIKRVSANEGIAGKVFSTGKPILAGNLAKESNNLLLRTQNASGSFMSIPLKVSNKIVGVMNFNRDPQMPGFCENDLVKLTSVDSTIAGLIEKEKLMATIDDNRQEISGLYALSCILSESGSFTDSLKRFLKKLSKQLKLDRSAIISLDSSHFDLLVPAPPEIGSFRILAAQNLKTEQLKQMFQSVSTRLKKQLLESLPENAGEDKLLQPPLSLSFDENGELHELFCIPLMVENRPSHLLLVSRRYLSDDHEKAKKHYRFLYLISQNLGMAIEREAMIERIREDQTMLLESATRDRIFLEISKDLTSTLDPYVILQKAFDQFSKVITYTSVSILLYDDLDNSYRIIVQPANPIGKKYQQALVENIFEVFKDYPCEPLLNKDNLLRPVIFKPQLPTGKSANSFKQTLHLPIIIGERVTGLIHLARSADKPFSSRELDITSQFTGIFITSIKNAIIHKKTEKLAFTDPLTGLFNHRYFQETLTHEFIRARRYDKPLSLMVIDIDFFKKFNDTYGHLVGDKVLRHVAGIFGHSIREQIDTVARYGGEEFAVILPETSLEGAGQFAERIRSKVEAAILVEDDQKLSVTLSIGVSCTSVTDCEKTSDLIAAADIALYQAKDQGRNLVKTYEERHLHNGN